MQHGLHDPVSVMRSIGGIHLAGKPAIVRVPVGDFAIASAAVQIELDKNGICRVAGIGVTGAGVVAQKALPVENLLQGTRITSELIEEAGRIIQQGAEPVEDTRGSAAYKKKALGAVLKRALREALQRSRS